MRKKIIYLLIASMLATQSLPVYAEPINEVITEEAVEITQESSQDTADVQSQVIDITAEESENITAEKTSKSITEPVPKDEKQEIKDREEKLRKVLQEELQTLEKDFKEGELSDVYFVCYNNKTDYLITECDSKLYVFYVRITPSGEFFLSRAKMSEKVEDKFRKMMVEENKTSSEMFWNKISLSNPDAGVFVSGQSVRWPMGVFNGRGGSIITPDIPLDNLIYTYEKWDRNWTGGTKQKALHDQYEMFDAEGFGIIGNRYVIACTLTFGNVGDCVDFYMSNGTVFKTVIGDIKSQHDPGCTKWGHKNGKNVIEFIVNSKIWYNTGHMNPGNPGCHPEWAGLSLVRAVNYGSVFDGVYGVNA